MEKIEVRAILLENRVKTLREAFQRIIDIEDGPPYEAYCEAAFIAEKALEEDGKWDENETTKIT